MKIKIKNSIYNGTLLEGLPFNYVWQHDRPENIYQIENKKIILYNFFDWTNINIFNTKNDLRNMFIHDICHVIFYHKTKQYHRIHLNDFGHNWDNVDTVDGKQIFKIKKHYEEEIKIVALGEILKYRYVYEHMIPYRKYMNIIETLLGNISLINNDTSKYKKECYRDAWNFWTKTDESIDDIISKVKKYLRKKYG